MAFCDKVSNKFIKIGYDIMPYQIRWLVPNKLLIINTYGELTIDDVANMSQESAVMVEESPEIMVHSITDLYKITSYPYNLMELTKAMNKLDLQQNKLGWALMIGISNPMLRFIATTLTQLKNYRFRIMDDVDGCFRFLHEVDETIPAEMSPEILNKLTES